MKPSAEEYAPFYAGYVSLVPESDVLAVLEGQPGQLRDVARAVPAPQETHRYQPGKWSVREVFGHIGDAERAFGHRAFCISRGERAPLPGFDENDYVARSGFDRRGLAELVSEFALLREANLTFLRRLDGPAWDQRGTANGSVVSLRALAFIMAGHVRHHLGVLRSRYGLHAGA